MTDPSSVSARLVVQEPAGTTWSHVLAGVTLIGRGDHCEIRLEDDRVSSDHAEIVRHGSSYLLTDLDSLNGTLLNGRRVEGSQRLRNADLIQAGGFRIELRLPARVPTSRDPSRSVELSDEERALAAALTEPFRKGSTFAARPPSVRELAEELHLSESSVKRRLASLARKLRIPPEVGADRSRSIADRVIALGLDRGA